MRTGRQKTLWNRKQMPMEIALSFLMVVGSVLSARTTTSRVASNATDAKSPKPLRTRPEDLSTCSDLRTSELPSKL